MKRKLEQILADVLSGVGPERLSAEERAALEASPEGREALETAALAAALDAERGAGLGPEAIARTRARLTEITGRSAGPEKAENFSILRRLRDAFGGVPRMAWAAGAAALALFVIAPRLMPEERVGQLAFAAGDLTLEEAGTSREIAAGPQTEVIRCESAVSAREGGAILIYDAGAAVCYGSDTRTRIAGVRGFELERGSVWVEVQRGGGDFSVQTAEAMIRVTGTAFEVARDDFGTRVSVAQGSVEVTAVSTGASLALQAGERTDVSIGARVLARSAGGADTPKWVAQLRGAAEAAAVGPLLPSVTGGPQGGTSP